MSNRFDYYGITLKDWVPSILLLPVAVFLIINHGKFIPVFDHLNLLFHEGGHGIFRMFGKLIYTAGGSLMQIIIPALIIYYFLSNNKKTGAQVGFLYLSENLMNVSVYVADARKQELPLLGGNKVYHDWNYLLSKTDLLSYDKIIGNSIFYLSVIIILLGLFLPLIIKSYAERTIDLKI